MSGQENRRHPETPSYRCFLSDLTGFAGLRRAGPTRTAVRIPDVGGDVNHPGACMNIQYDQADCDYFHMKY